MRLRNQVRRMRLERGLSQREMARLTGLSRQTLYAIERDDGYDTSSRIQGAIAGMLGVPTAACFWHEAERPSEAVAS